MPNVQHVAFVCPRFSEGPTVGGAETLLQNLAVRLAQSGLKVSFLTTCARDHFTWRNDIPEGNRESNGINIFFFPVDEDRDLSTFFQVQDKISRGNSVSPAEEELWLHNNVNSRPLCDHIACHGDDYDRIIVGPYLFGLSYRAAMLMPSKTILVPCLHDEPFAYLTSFQKLFHSVRTVMFNTAPERDLAVSLYDLKQDASPRLHVVGMGMEKFPVRPGDFTSRHPGLPPYVLYSGRREPLKGTPLLIDYMHAFRVRTKVDVNLVLTGTGPIEIPDGMAGHCIDMGFVSEEEKHAVMADALAFCHPSVNESLGIVILESWLAGTPALVHAKSRVLTYQCRSSNGGLWFRNYPEFEEELLLLLNDEEIRRSLAESGRKYVLKEYSWGTITDRLLAAINE